MTDQSPNRPVRVRETLGYVIDDIRGVKPAPLPANLFSYKYPRVKYPYSINKNKAYSYFGLGLEEEVAMALKRVYKTQFVGAVDDWEFSKRFPYLSQKDRERYEPDIIRYIKGVVDYLVGWYPPSAISHISYQHELKLLDDQGNPTGIVGHPDIIVWIDPGRVVIYDVKVFALTNLEINKQVKLQICSYAALARSEGIECDHVGVIMPWDREDQPVVDFDIEKWKSPVFSKILQGTIEKVIRAPQHSDKWCLLLQHYSVGSHADYKSVIEIARSYPDFKLPMQIFLYGNAPSPQREEQGRLIYGLEGTGPLVDFSKHQIFVHIPYNMTLSVTKPYVIDGIKSYLADAYRLGVKGVVIHTGHHPDEAEGLKVMKRNLDAIVPFIHWKTPLIIETPCGNKNEMLNTAEKLSNFVMDYPSHLVGLCIDTCHVFVSGAMPTDYIKDLYNMNRDNNMVSSALDRVCLIHFNGSRNKFGCCADRHSHVTYINNIPDEELERVLDLADTLNIPCLTE